VIFCDVDGTLITSGQVNARLVDWLRLRHNEGFELVLWSSRGREHAEKAASIAGCAELFQSIVSKPGYIVDDKGWAWIKYTRNANALSVLGDSANAI
jgi:predicted mannosyl-3-phosphoglycerate phosphatase (HAD superfamily)